MQGGDIMCLKLFHASIIVALIVLQYFNISLSLEFNNISLGVVGHKDIVKVPKVIRCIEREGEALLAFKQGLAYDDNLLSSWGREVYKQDGCKWAGIHYSNRTGRIIQLNLGQSYLSEAYSLQEEGDPEFYYHLQDFIGSLSNLRHLDLSDASFAGRFPSHVGNLTHLQYLDISFNFFANVENLNSWPPNLSSLTYLNMSSNNLSNVYDWMEAVNKLPKLTNLTLTKCGLLSLIHPSTLFNINSSKYLAHVDLNSNQFTSPLIFLWLSNYNVSPVYLDLSYNSITGLIPHVFGNMRPLAFLPLGYNHLVGSLPNLANCSSLEELGLSYNQLNGTIPKSIGQMSN
ncbi:hypothetical protein C1H46_010501 [Malus baccata]|uniref:Leucine-rich repeat-containing N-terminal plant-type domain-containing protein n=1 Tax=Malus baccata TaxID=106549 RepID=A0A540MYG6_MALBA|nr:hypothetical protein C1H46_010501 [Malus baccata]